MGARDSNDTQVPPGPTGSSPIYSLKDSPVVFYAILILYGIFLLGFSIEKCTHFIRNSIYNPGIFILNKAVF